MANGSERWATTTSDAMITATATISHSEDHHLAASSWKPRSTAAPALAGRLAASGESGRSTRSINAFPPRPSESFERDSAPPSLRWDWHAFASEYPQLQ